MAEPQASHSGDSRRVVLPRNTGARRYAVAIIAVAATAGVRAVLPQWVQSTVPYLQFFPAILIAGWYGGVGPCLVSTLLSAAIATSVFLPPGLAASDAGNVLSLILFLAAGAGISALYRQLGTSDVAHRASAALATTRAERLAAIINTSVDGIIVIDSKGRIEAFNRGAERLFGYPESEVTGRNVNMLMPSPDHDRHDAYLDRYLTTGATHIIGKGREVTGRRRDGTTFPLHLSVGEMILDGERKFTGMLHDLTDRVRLEDQLRTSEARWRAVIDSAVDGIVVIDAYGRIEAFNPAAERLFGYLEAEVHGQNVHMLMPSPYREEHDNYLMRYLATSKAKIIGIGREVAGRRKDGTTFPLHLSVGEIKVSGEKKFTGILHDLSARVVIEERLREQTAMARLGEMSAVIAHEVKNPLAGIRGAIQIISKRLPEGSGDAAVAAEVIMRIDSLDRMMKDLLMFARPQRLQLAPTDVLPLLEATSVLLAADPAVSGVRVSIHGSAPRFSADGEMLKIVFQNLLMNSAQAMGGQGNIRIDLTTDASFCFISITDDGPGIPEDLREKIFTPFFTTKSRGSGLGLPTAKRIVESHRGGISVQNPPSGGTTVVIQLPLE